MYSGCMQLVL